MTTATAVEPVYGRIPLELIDVPPEQAREHGDLSGLQASMASEGLINPITVRQSGDRYQLMAGGRRLAAARELGWETIPSQVRDADEVTRHVLRTTENVQRHQIHPVEEAREYDRLHKGHNLTQQEIARRVGRSAHHVSQRLALLELPEEYQGLIDSDHENSINLGEAQALTRLAGHPDLIEAAHKAILAGTPADNAVQGQMARLERERARTAVLEGLRAQNRVPFEGVLGKDGWAVSDHPEPGHLYLPADRLEQNAAGFEWTVDGDNRALAVCTNPAAWLADHDAQVAASAQALISTVATGTAEAPAQPLSEEEAARRADSEERKHWRELRKADERREAFLTKRARAGIKAGDVSELIYQGFLDSLTPAARELVYVRCNVPKVEKTDGFGETWDLDTYFAGRGSRLKLAYAAALGVAEAEVDQAVKSKTRMLHGEAADRVARYFQHLEGTGYALCPQEQELADLDTPETPDDSDNENEEDSE